MKYLARRLFVAVDDKFSEDCTSTAVNKENIDAVRTMIKTGRHVTCHEIRESLGISINQIQSILHKQLDIKKLCSPWIPHNLTEAQKTNRVT
ncbi:hypothetical protein EVAR_55836_1 [Eumeta japonica]|uniref:Histone-lysine N-methyltransferase SETMAR n=1 Tax=Eumeta variegata TaxID=151549 RepID=A0A4C1YWV5_EUMVA|nr:hypothetical protein EVAR_55836_1 [Eumeta japonica]